MKILKNISDDVRIVCEEVLNLGFPRSILDYHIGGGQHGKVFSIPNTNLVIKIFTDKGKANEAFDYKYLSMLSGIECVPLMYAYAENEFVLMEKINGINLNKYLEIHKSCSPKIRELIKQAIYAIGERKIGLPDLNVMEDILWIEEEEKLKIIDFGLCDDCSHMPDGFIKGYIDNEIERCFEELDNYELWLKSK